MPIRVEPLSPSDVQNAKPRAKRYAKRDGRGLVLLIDPSGSKLWRFDYRRPGTGKRNTLSLGTFPAVSLKKARERRDEVRRLLADGIDPADKRQAERQAQAETFEAVAREWYAKHEARWAPTHRSKLLRRLERDVFPWLGARPIATITAPDLLAVARRVEARGAVDTAHRDMLHCGQVIRYAIATGRAMSDPTPALRGALMPHKPGHFLSITDPAKVGELLRAIDGYTGSFPVRCALQLAALTFVRPGELRAAEWKDFDLDAVEWRFHVTKTDTDHIVPLSTQALTILRELKPLTGAGRYLFPGMGDRDRSLSDMALNVALRRMGYGDIFTPHGFRAMARTILDEQLGFRPDYIEHQLAHAVKDPNGRAYNRTKHLPERRKMMQSWGDYLDTLRTGAQVVPFRSRA